MRYRGRGGEGSRGEQRGPKSPITRLCPWVGTSFIRNPVPIRPKIDTRSKSSLPVVTSWHAWAERVVGEWLSGYEHRRKSLRGRQSIRSCPNWADALMADAATSPTKTRLGSGKREMPLDVRGRQTSRVLQYSVEMKHAVQLASGPALEMEWE
jgi:hypothetical protein